MKLSSSPRSLHIRCSLNPKNQTMEHLPLCAISLNVLWIWILRFLHTRDTVNEADACELVRYLICLEA